VFGFAAEDIWVTVFEGDDALGLGRTRRRSRAGGCRVELERIVQCPRAENFWQAGPTGPCGPCSELYIDQGVERGSARTCGRENERFLEYWNLVFMQYEAPPQTSVGRGVLAAADPTATARAEVILSRCRPTTSTRASD